MNSRQRVIVLVSALLLVSHSTFAASAEYFYNPPENINPDPNYTPGDYALADVYASELAYQTSEVALINEAALGDDARVFTLGAGEISFSSTKNETASVLGYFRNYLGVGEVGGQGPTKMEMIIDINSLDTAVPGRNNRILNLFFKSMMPDLGTARIVFYRLDISEVKDKRGSQSMTAVGTMTLNGVSQSIAAELMMTQEGRTWKVETKEPLSLLISDFGFRDEIYELMRECNHQSLRNQVDVSVKLYFR
jgi:hypothetical protein